MEKGSEIKNVRLSKITMRLLFITQVIDEKDPYLSFVQRWIAAFAREFDSITAICLKKGAFTLPKNVKVLSLGKEKKQSRISYLFNFYRYIWNERKNYDAVFVHMNQEYVLLAGWFWRMTGKRVYMWRNHYAGSMLTGLAAFFCNNVFCTSKFSYTARFEKTIFMPVGVDTDFFKPVAGIVRAPKSILFFARMSPSKRPDVLVEALGILKSQNVHFSASFVGDALPVDAAYYESLKRRAAELGINDKIQFKSGVPNDQTPAIYSSHEIFVNLSPSGMYDKTIFEAMACGDVAMACSEDLAGKVDARFLFQKGDANEVAEKLAAALALSDADRAKALADMRALAESQGLAILAKLLRKQISAL
jgi:glycosyltransferase involved in cell wall biosynthesis